MRRTHEIERSETMDEVARSQGQDTAVAALVRRARKGHRASLEQLTLRIQPRLSSYFASLSRDPDRTGEWLQETLLKMLQNLHTLRDPEAFWGWLYRIANNVFRDHCRSRKRTAAVPFSAMQEPQLQEALRDRRPAARGRVARKELSEQLTAAMMRIKKTHREIFTMRCLKDMSYRQISDRLGCTEVNARAGYSRARRKLQQELESRGVTPA